MSTGALRTRWAKAHGDARITSMAFDLNFRRLITGCENGSVKVAPELDSRKRSAQQLLLFETCWKATALSFAARPIGFAYAFTWI